MTIRDYWFSIIMNATLNESLATMSESQMYSIVRLYTVCTLSKDTDFQLNAESPSQLVTKPIVKIVSHHHHQQQLYTKLIFQAHRLFVSILVIEANTI